MELRIDSGECDQRRHRPEGSEAQGQSTPAASGVEAFTDDLYARYWTNLVGYLNSMLRDLHQAEEIAQETMLRAWRHADSLSAARGSVWGWLCRVGRNIMIDRMRHKRVRPAEVHEAAVDTSANAVADHSDDVVNSIYVANALTRLQPSHRTVLLLVYYHRRTCTEAAAVLGVPVGTVKSRLHAALRQIRAVLEQQDQAERG